MTDWSFEDVPDQTGRTAIVTGANTGIGFETARMLALRGARVILACRDQAKGSAALDSIVRERADAAVQVSALDLSDLDSVRTFSERVSAEHKRLDLLVDNAGVMVPPFTKTKHGFELQFGTNHLGHFALTARLWQLLARTPGARVVVVSSAAAHDGRIDFKDPNFDQRRYGPWRAYQQSKLANNLFALELARRASAAEAGVTVTAAHPGWTSTDLQRNAPFMRRFNSRLAMSPAAGALPTLRAATDPHAANGSYWGPARFFELNGPPVPAKIPKGARDARIAERLWTLSEQLTGVDFAVTPNNPTTTQRILQT